MQYRIKSRKETATYSTTGDTQEQRPAAITPKGHDRKLVSEVGI